MLACVLLVGHFIAFWPSHISMKLGEFIDGASRKDLSPMSL